MHTEQDARKLWCPMARDIVTRGVPEWTQGGGETQVGNRCENEPISTCIASDCAMWVRGAFAARQYRVCEPPTAIDEPPRPTSVPDDWEWCPYEDADGEPAGWREPESARDGRNRGHCGLIRRNER